MRTKQSVKQHLKLASIGFGALLAFVLGLSACSNPSGGGGNNSGNPDNTPSGFRVTFVHNVPNTTYMRGTVPPALPNVEDGYTITLPSFDPGQQVFTGVILIIMLLLPVAPITPITMSITGCLDGA